MIDALALAAQPPPGAGDVQLATAAILGIATVVVPIAWLRVHPFLALMLGSAVLGVAAGMSAGKIVEAFTAGVATTTGSVGLLIALGAMIGALVADSGAADRIVETVIDAVQTRRLPWAIAGVAALIGLPLFFEIGVVLLVPIILLVWRRIDVPLMKLGIPALAGLSVLHGLVPPHPGPLVAISTLNADLGLTLAFGLVIAIPTIILAGPVFGSLAGRFVQSQGPTMPAAARRTPAKPPGFSIAVLTLLLPIVLMLLRAAGELVLPAASALRAALDVAGTPVVALLAGTIVSMFTLGAASGLDRRQISESVGGSLPPIAAMLLIVAAGGGLKQTLIDAGVGTMIGRSAQGLAMSPLILGWLVAVGIRLATGSATVATVTAAGLVAPLAGRMDRAGTALLALAIGSGSLFFSHVNDAGFWLVKEYFGLSLGETLKTWSVMETIISVAGLIGVLVLAALNIAA